MAKIASFHLVSDQPGIAGGALLRLATDRRAMGRVPGLRFWRLLGTGSEDETAPSIDVRRTALFAVWDDEDALDRFLATHPIAQRWRDAAEVWHTRLRGLGGHGAWRRFPVLRELEPGDTGGRIAVVTRARVRAGALPEFVKASTAVSDEMRASGGLRALVGIGESPFSHLGTFSVWESFDTARAAAAGPVHRDVVARAHAGRWFTEQLFARFEPFASSGSWDGRDPVGDPPTGGQEPRA